MSTELKYVTERMKNNRNIPVVIIIISLILAGFYFVIILKNKPDETWNWLHTFISTLLSVIIGFATGILLYDIQTKSTDKKRRNELKELLRAELSDIYNVLTRDDFVVVTLNNQERLKVKITYIQPIILEECAKCGLFNSVETENFLHVARKIRFYNTLINYLLSILSKPDSTIVEALVKHAAENIESNIKGITSNITQILQQLKLTLSDSYKYK